jgi:hypothetical protein
VRISSLSLTTSATAIAKNSSLDRCEPGAAVWHAGVWRKRWFVVSDFERTGRRPGEYSAFHRTGSLKRFCGLESAQLAAMIGLARRH